MINPFYNAYREVEDHELTHSLNEEAIQMLGYDVVYLRRQHVDFDALLGEDPNNKFTWKKENVIEMYCNNVEGFEGDNEVKSFFGDLWQSSGTFVVNKKRFKEQFPDMERPLEGDLIFMPYSEAILEVKYVDTDSEFFPQSGTVFYSLRAEVFRYSHEDIVGDYSDIEDEYTADAFKYTVDENIILDPENDTGKYGDNDLVEDEYKDRIKIEKKDPFRPKH